MYSPHSIAASIDKLCETHHVSGVREIPVQEVDSWMARLRDARGPKGEELRALAAEEQAFIINELILCKSSFRYWAQRYAKCSTQGAGVKRMFPLFDTQELILEELGRIEDDALAGSDDGILVNCLKARRLGASTLAQALLAHRLTLQTYLYGVTASDVPEQSGYTFGMFKLIYQGLPWYLRPALETERNTFPQEYALDNHSQYWTHAGQSVRGVEGERGQLGRGKGVSVCHLTELSTWDDPDQIDSALLPTMQPSPRILAIFESSPRGRNNWWHEHWQISVAGDGRFKPIFLPWYAEPRTYRREAPLAWSPNQATLAHAKRCELQGKRWLHRDVSLTRSQLYWYEFTRAYYERKDKLADFLQEYAADPEECFVFSGKGVIPFATIQRLTDGARMPVGAFEVVALKDVRI